MYQDLSQNLAPELIKEFGFTADIVSKDQTKDAGGKVVTTTEKQQVHAIMTTVKTNQIDGTLIKAGDVVLIIATYFNGVEIKPIEVGNEFSKNGRTYRIYLTEAPQPDGTIIVYRAYARLSS